MLRVRSVICFIFFIISILSPVSLLAKESLNIPILCYHNFNPTKPGYMNMKPETFEAELKWLKDNGYTVIPLKDAVEYLQGKRDSLPKKAVVITADDGWKSQYTYMMPLIRKYNVPVTLFIYPQTISEGKNSLTWEELKEMQQTGLFDIQGHTYDHPNFKHAKKNKTAENFEKYVDYELAHSKKVLEDKLNIKVSYLAWPFGIYDAFLEKKAADAGYAMAFSIDHHTANRYYPAEAQPRFMILEANPLQTFAALVKGANKISKQP
jgi:peptidoglycan/xylan/chitin deacetylase (PgdA/CDA1 family)